MIVSHFVDARPRSWECAMVFHAITKGRSLQSHKPQHALTLFRRAVLQWAASGLRRLHPLPALPHNTTPRPRPRRQRAATQMNQRHSLKVRCLSVRNLFSMSILARKPPSPFPCSHLAGGSRNPACSARPVGIPHLFLAKHTRFLPSP